LTILNNQTVGNVGLYYVCYRLSLLGWNVMPTSRNAKGVDIIAHSQDARCKLALQVRALSKRNAVSLGKSPNLIADWLIVCRYVKQDKPECLILSPGEVKRLSHPSGKGTELSHWLEPPKYEAMDFREKWERLVAPGISALPGSGI
jgi:hypothetical protein